MFQQTQKLLSLGYRHFLLFLLLSASSGAQPIEHAVGKWKIFHGGGQPIFVQVNSDGTAQCRGAEATRGAWKLVGGRLELTWNDGWRDVIVRRGSTYRKLGYGPKHPGQGPPDHETAAFRRP